MKTFRKTALVGLFAALVLAGTAFALEEPNVKKKS